MNALQEPPSSPRLRIRRQADLRLRDPSVRAPGAARRLGWAAMGKLAKPPSEKEWIQVQFYHWVLEDQRDIFRRQLKSLRQYGDFISLDDTVNALRSGSKIGGRYFCVTFDDGFKNCYINAAPILRDLKVPAAFFLPTKYIGLDFDADWAEIAPFYERSYLEFEGAFEFLDWNECRNLISAGFTIGSHTHSHRRLTSLTESEVMSEMQDSKSSIERHLGIDCRHFCCPWGKVNRDFHPAVHPALARQAGYDSFLTTEDGLSSTGSSAYYIRRMGCEPDHNPAMLKYALFSNLRRGARARARRKRDNSTTLERLGETLVHTSSEPEFARLRKFPYPFQAAFTIASDIDSASVARFRAIHALVCGSGVILPGSSEWQTLGLNEGSICFDERAGGVPGLGLPIGDSFFLVGDRTTFGMYREGKGPERFVEDGQNGVNCKSLIQSYIKRGEIDSFHAFLHYTRDEVRPILESFYRWCEEEKVAKPCVWINHSLGVTPTGLCPDQLQPNPLGRLARLSARSVVGPVLGRKRLPLRTAFARYQGDTPSSPYYVNDLLTANGLRYVWLNMDDLERNRVCLPERILNGRETILDPITMDDGIRHYRFHRCYGKPRGRKGGESYLKDSADGFDATCLISEENLAELCRNQGSCILYTHWAHSRSFPVRDETLGRLALLKRWAEEGKVWVAPLSRLLEWTRRRTFLSFTAKRSGDHLLLELGKVEDPIFSTEALSLSDYHGMCFELSEPFNEVTVIAAGNLLGPHQVRQVGNLCWLNLRPGV